MRPTAIAGDVFAGLFAYGVRRAGFRVTHHLEHGHYGGKMAALNLRGTALLHDYTTWGQAPPADFMFCNPPCAPWSAAGKCQGRCATETRHTWVTDLRRAGLAAGVKAWVWECVTGVWRKDRAFVLQHARWWRKHGYHVCVLLQNNLYLGAPQNRKRLMLIAHKHPLVWPRLTLEHRTLRELLEEATVTIADVRAARINKRYVKLWRAAPRYRGKFREASLALEPERSGHPSFNVLRLDPDKPPGVVLVEHHHPFEARMFAWPEQLVLHGLPPTWRSPWASTFTNGQVLQRSVLPDVGFYLGRAVKNGLRRPALRGPPLLVVREVLSPEVTEEEL